MNRPFREEEVGDLSALRQVFRLLVNAPNGSLFTKLRIKDSLVYGFDFKLSCAVKHDAELTVFADPEDFDYVADVSVRKLEEIASGNIPEMAWKLTRSQNHLRALEVKGAWTVGVSDYLEALFGAVRDRWRDEAFEEPSLSDILEGLTTEDLVRLTGRLLENESSIIGLRNPT